MTEIKRGDVVELFAVYPGRWISRGHGVVRNFVGDGLACVRREEAHDLVANLEPYQYCTVMVKEIPYDKDCQCLLNNVFWNG